MQVESQVEASGDFHIKDINEWEMGRREIEMAEIEMPGLMACRTKYNTKPFAGKKISGSLHMTIQTAVLIETLHDMGANVRWCSCNIYSTQDHAAAAVVRGGKGNVFAWKNLSGEDYWSCTLRACTWPDGSGPDSIVDDGGDMTMLLLEGMKAEIAFEKNGELPDETKAVYDDEIALFLFLKKTVPENSKRYRKLSENIVGITEETTTGVARLYQLSALGEFPWVGINVNDSVTKSKFDNVYGCRHSSVDGVLRATDVLISGKRVLICGYGDVGKGTAQAFKAQNAQVSVTEVDPICALQACMEGFRVVKIETVVAETDIFISATGNKEIIRIEHMEKMKNNAIVGNIGHFDNEIDMNGLKAYPGIKKQNIKPQTDRWVFPDDHGVIVLAEGRLLNLGCATGHPSFVMSNSFTNQVMAQIALYDQEFACQKYEAGKIYVLPKHLDEEVARLHLPALGAELTELRTDQASYIGLDGVRGPFKKDEYRY
jgi:adenosylhomocysteinase